MSSLLSALRRATRRLWKAPAFTLPATVTLGLGIGAAAATLTFVNAVVFRSLPYPDPDRLVSLRHSVRGDSSGRGGLSDGLYLHYLTYSKAFEDIGLYIENDGVTITDGGDAERVRVTLVTPSVFSMLGVRPALGRVFTPDDGLASATTVVVISHDLWTRRYGGDASIVGRSIELNRKRLEVVGVLPPGFGFPRPETQVWYSLSVDPARAQVHDPYLSGIARLRPGVSRENAERDLRRLGRSLARAFPDATPDVLRDQQFQPLVIPLKDVVIGDARRPLLVLLGTTLFVLLITWTNVANLVLVRAGRQQKEISVEQALGASGADLARRVLSESAILAVLGGALGFALAYGGVAFRFGFERGQIPRLDEIRVDGVMLGVVVTLALLSGLLLGLVALVRAVPRNVSLTLKGVSGRVTGGREWRNTQRILVAMQVASALTLLVGSGVMVKTFLRLKEVKLGFESQQVLTLDLSLPYEPYATYRDAARFHHQLLEQLRIVPGVSTADVVMVLPLVSRLSSLTWPLAVEGGEASTSEGPDVATVNFATPGYFATMRIPLVQGRAFSAGDFAAEAPPVIISMALARTLFRGENPVGKRVQLVGPSPDSWSTVIGVVDNVVGESLAGGPARMLYFPVVEGLKSEPQLPYIPRGVTVVARTSLPPTSLVTSLRRIVREIDPKVPVTRVGTMEDIVAGSTARIRLTMLLLLVGAGAALLLGTIGIYSVIAYSVARRMPEFGIRLALGASPRDVKRLVLGEGVLLSLIGVSVGVVTALGLTRFMRGLLFEVSPSDPVTFAAMSALLLSVATVASYLPARRAGRTDPAQVLKSE